MKRRIIEEMRAQRQQSEAEADRSIGEVFAAIGAVLKADRRVTVPGFGTFRRDYQAERQSRNPRTGEPIKVAGREVTKFREPRQRTR